MQAIVQSYIAQNKDYSRNANRDQTELLKQQLMKLASDIDVKKAALKALIRSGKIAVLQPGEFLNTKNDADASQPALRKVTESVLQQIMGEMVRSDLEYHDATSHLEATRVVRERNLNKLSDELGTGVAAEFEKGPRAHRPDASD